MVPILTKHRANQREGRQNLKKTVLPVVNYEVEKLGCLDSSESWFAFQEGWTLAFCQPVNTPKPSIT